MKIGEIAALLDATCILGEERRDEEVIYGFASDLMSDVLTLTQEGILLITGLCNIQTIRTAEMANIQFILFARNKQITKDMLTLAKQENMVLLQTRYSLFKTSGILYQAGLKSVY